MAEAIRRNPDRVIHPVHAILLACSLPLFGGALLSDWAYSSTFEVQWINFASWLVSAGAFFASLALLWAAIDYFRADRGRGHNATLYLVTLVVMVVLGVINAFIHSKDVWATMPAGLILSVLVFLLSLVAVWLGFSTLRSGDAR